MTRIRFILLSVIVPALCAVSLDDDAPGFDDHIKAGDERSALETIDLSLDMQIEEIAAYIPTEQIKTLRSEHYTWRLQRDLQCADVERKSSDELAELKCLSKLSDEYFDRREAEIVEIEARLAKALGTEVVPTGEQ